MRLRLRVSAGVLALVSAVAIAAPAYGATVELDRGTTTVRLRPATVTALRAAGVAVLPIAPATGNGQAIALPITGGRIDPGSGAGEITQAGGLQLRRRGVRISLVSITVRTGVRRALTAQVGRARVRAFSLSSRHVRVRRPGFATTIAGLAVAVTADGAAVLNRALGIAVFRRGQRLGTATVRSRPAQIAFDGGATALALDAGVGTALQSAGVSVAPAAPAFTDPDGSIALPIVGGKVNATTLAGSFAHRGGLVFARGPTTVVVADLEIRTLGRPQVRAVVGGRRVDLFAFDVSRLTETPAARTETLAGGRARLTGRGAAVLDETFGTTVFARGQVFGALTIAAHVA